MGEPSAPVPVPEAGSSGSSSGRFPAERPDATKRAKRTLAGWDRTGFGRPMPVPGWAVSVVGGAITAPLAGVVLSPKLGAGNSTFSAAGIFVALAIYGAACGALATITTGRAERRIAVAGAVAGGAVGLLAVLGSTVHEFFMLVTLVALVSLPSAIVARALHLPAREAVPLWSLSLVSVGAGALPVCFAMYMANDSLLNLDQRALAQAFMAAVGILAWYRPASYRPGART